MPSLYIFLRAPTRASTPPVRPPHARPATCCGSPMHRARTACVCARTGMIKSKSCGMGQEDHLDVRGHRPRGFRLAAPASSEVRPPMIAMRRFLPRCSGWRKRRPRSCGMGDSRGLWGAGGSWDCSFRWSVRLMPDLRGRPGRRSHPSRQELQRTFPREYNSRLLAYAPVFRSG